MMIDATRSALRRAAAVLWAFDPLTLRGEGEATPRAAALTALVDDVRALAAPGPPRWRLRPEVRAAALAELPSIEALRRARAANPAADTEPEQAQIDALLRGETLDLAALDDAALARLTEVADWFKGRLPGLPSRAVIDATLRARWLRAPLEAAGARALRGRTAELDRLRAWLRAGSGLLVVHGPGGVGKSTLAAAFALELLDPAAPVSAAWLDVARPDVDPERPSSLLALALRQLRWQTALGLDVVFAALADDKADALAAFARAWHTAVGDRPWIWLVDGLEETLPPGWAEWLTALTTTAPIRVALVARGPLPGLAAETIALGALDEQAALAMLAAQGLGPQTAARLYREHGGHPGRLHAAIHSLNPLEVAR